MKRFLVLIIAVATIPTAFVNASPERDQIISQIQEEETQLAQDEAQLEKLQHDLISIKNTSTSGWTKVGISYLIDVNRQLGKLTGTSRTISLASSIILATGGFIDIGAYLFDSTDSELKNARQTVIDRKVRLAELKATVMRAQ